MRVDGSANPTMPELKTHYPASGEFWMGVPVRHLVEIPYGEMAGRCEGDVRAVPYLCCISAVSCVCVCVSHSF